MRIEFMSFGHKSGHGVPPAIAVFDVRHCANPYHVKSLRDFNGLDQIIQDYVFSDCVAVETFEAILAYARLVADRTSASFIRFAVGCHGGRHRSVAFAHRLAQALADDPRHANDDVVACHRERF